MTREGWRLTHEDWQTWIESLLQAGKRVIAPVNIAGELLAYRPIGSAAEISLEGYTNTRWSPKEFLFPSTETLFSYRFNGDEVELEGPETDERQQVLLGVRPCDAAGMSRLDDIFLGDEEDPFHAARRGRTTVVSLACDEVLPQCFCTAVGGSPGGTEGADLQIVNLDDALLLQVLSEQGRNLVEPLAGEWTLASDHDRSNAEDRQRALEEQIHRNSVPLEWARTLQDAFGEPVWEAIGERCLSCGICAYVCPSCSCFDVNDDGDAFCNTRCRIWDSCAFAGFTRHASGHNPRSSPATRYRQRTMHKFSYFPLQQGENFMCVGCGRCTALCPVGIDIHRAVQEAVGAVSSAGVDS